MTYTGSLQKDWFILLYHPDNQIPEENKEPLTSELRWGQDHFSRNLYFRIKSVGYPLIFECNKQQNRKATKFVCIGK